MRIDRADGEVVEITLSRRNAAALLHKADQAWSAKELQKHDPDPGVPLLIVHVEPDAEHYDRPEGRPGPLHPATEDFVQDA